MVLEDRVVQEVQVFLLDHLALEAREDQQDHQVRVVLEAGVEVAGVEVAATSSYSRRGYTQDSNNPDSYSHSRLLGACNLKHFQTNTHILTVIVDWCIALGP